MHRQRSNRTGGGQPNAAREVYDKIFLGKIVTITLLAVVLGAGLAGCSSSPARRTSDPEAKVRLTWLTRFYRMYTNQNKKPPADEQAFKGFIQQLPQAERDAAGIGGDLDSFMMSPNDGQKYHIQYGTRLEGPNRALAWEETGQEGKRWVALTMGYVAHCDEEMFQNYKKKK
jgi:hypothetical protein